MIEKQKLEKKFKEIYPKMMGVAIRYGIPTVFLQDHFIEHHEMDINSFKNTMITNWALSKNKPVKHKTEDIFMDAMNYLNPLERIVYNMVTIEEYEDVYISDLLNIENEIINNTYINAQTKIKQNEKITSYFNSDVNNDVSLELSI